MALYSNPTARVRVNGHLSQSFLLSQGTQQGCLSPLLFLLAIEPLISSFRENPDLDGIRFASGNHVVAAYTDNVLLFSEDAERAIPSIMKMINNYSAVSGYSLNKEKTEVFPLNVHCTADVIRDSGLKWQSSVIKYLGIWFTLDLKNSILLNKQKTILKSKTSLPLGSRRTSRGGVGSALYV